MVMIFRRVELPGGVPGSLYLHSMPGRYEDWTAFVSEAEGARLDLIVGLTAPSEIQRRSPAYARARLAGALPCDVVDFPIPDFEAPPLEKRPSFRNLVARLADDLKSGAKVLVHCGEGIGRTGMLAVCVLLELGLDTREARRRVSDAGSGSEVKEQKELILWYSSGCV